MTNYNISITSDVVCPWCYIGHARLSRAISNHRAQYPSDTFTLVYKPYYLNPIPTSAATSSFPIKSEPRKAFYVNKFGSVARVEQIFDMLGRVAAQEGLDFKFGGNTGHSRNAHRLVWWAQQQQQQSKSQDPSASPANEDNANSLQNKVMLGLWKRYFEQETDITQLDVLIDVGVEAGLGKPGTTTSQPTNSSSSEGKEEEEEEKAHQRNSIRDFLLSSEGSVEVDRVAEAERRQGITGVPFYNVQGVWDVEGAQEPRAFEALFRRWKDIEAKEAKKTKNGGETGAETTKLSCAVGENC